MQENNQNNQNNEVEELDINHLMPVSYTHLRAHET